MENPFSLAPQNIQKQLALQEVRQSNETSAKFGLSLSERQIQTLVERRFAALKNTGRVEFGGGILPKLIYAFCSSPYLQQANYEDALVELQDSFYYFKNESLDYFTDDELLTLMRRYFDTVCQGSLEQLSSTTLEEICRDSRYGSRDYDDQRDLYRSPLYHYDSKRTD